MYKVGDEVLVKGAITDLHEGTDHPYFVAVNYDSVHWVSEDKIIPMDKTYEQGLSDAWELAKKICTLKNSEFDKVFGCVYFADAFYNFTPEEALAKIEAYEKEKSEIKVGDEVVHGIGGCETKFIVTSMSDGMIRGFDSNGIIHSFTFPNRFITKTGKHIDIESLLRQIGE